MRVVFRYEDKPTNNFLGTDGSSDAVVLFDTGIIRYEHYLFRCDMPSITKDIGPFPEVVAQVEKLLSLYASEIEDFPTFIDNSCDDGSWQYFRFYDKEIVVDNMRHYSKEAMRTIRLLHEGEQLDKIMLSVRQTNTVVEIYQKIAAIIRENCDLGGYLQ